VKGQHLGHTKPEALADLRVELQLIRSLTGITERSPGVFYWKSTAFLHFHDQDGKRWADVKSAAGWKHVAIDFVATAQDKADFIAETRQAYAELTRNRKKP